MKVIGVHTAACRLSRSSFEESKTDLFLFPKSTGMAVASLFCGAATVVVVRIVEISVSMMVTAVEKVSVIVILAVTVVKTVAAVEVTVTGQGVTLVVMKD